VHPILFQDGILHGVLADGVIIGIVDEGQELPGSSESGITRLHGNSLPILTGGSFRCIRKEGMPVHKKHRPLCQLYHRTRDLQIVYAFFCLCGILISEITRRQHYGKIYPLRKAFQEGKAQAGSGKAADLGPAESRHQKAGKQQGLQQKQSPELEA
jgi:hypothetical protein